MAREAGWKDLRDYDSQMQHDFFLGSIDSLKAFEVLVRADERKNFCATLRQMHDAYSLASDPSGLKVRGNT
jgi:hypothetical protein